MYEIIHFTTHGDTEGNLIALEEKSNIPFPIRRVYYIWGTQKDIIRGKHAHRNLEQVIVCLAGSCDFLLDDSTTRTSLHLHTPTQGLYLKNLIWREFTNFSSDCILMVLASEIYKEEDYIRDYRSFIHAVSAQS